jgi:hypothetical protein
VFYSSSAEGVACGVRMRENRRALPETSPRNLKIWGIIRSRGAGAFCRCDVFVGVTSEEMFGTMEAICV